MYGPELTLLQAGLELFARRLAAVEDRHARWSTPCEGWTVSDLAEHVIAGNEMAVELLVGGQQLPLPPASGGAAQGLHAAFDRSAVRQHQAFSAAGPNDVVAHPAQPVPVRHFAIYRCGDIVVHAWDLARAIGVEDGVDSELVDRVLEPYVRWVATLDTAGVFAEPVASTSSAHESRLDQLLRRLGRRP